MESKLIKVKTDGDILRDAYVIAGLDIDGSEYVVYYIDRDDGENDNLFVSKLIKNNDGTYNLLNIENANEKINISNTVKQIVKYAIDDAEHDTLVGNSITLGAKVIKLCPVIVNKEQTVDIQKTYITTVKKSVTAVTKKYYDVSFSTENLTVKEEIFPVAEDNSVFVNPTDSVSSPQGDIVSSVTTASVTVAEPVVTQTVPTAVEPVLPSLEVVQTVTQPNVADNNVATSAPVVAEVKEVPVASVNTTPVVNVQPSAPVLDIPAGIISTPVVEQPVSSAVAATVVEHPVSQQVVQPSNVSPVVSTSVTAPVQVTVPVAEPVVAQTVAPVKIETPVAPVVNSAPTVEQPTPEKLVLDASKESNLNSALGEISKESISVPDINAIKEFGEDDPVVSTVTVAQPEVSASPKVLTKKAGFANSKFFMFIAIGFFVASCIFMGYEAFTYYQLVK